MFPIVPEAVPYFFAFPGLGSHHGSAHYPDIPTGTVLGHLRILVLDHGRLCMAAHTAPLPSSVPVHLAYTSEQATDEYRFVRLPHIPMPNCI